MALSSEDRYPTASEFRGALSRVGRSEMASTKAIADLSLAQSAGDATINTMVPRRVTGSDPFHGYSILKPAETAWLAPQQSSHPAVIAAVLAIVLTAAVGAFYTFGHGIDSKLSVLDTGKPAPKNNSSATAVVRQANSDNSRAKPAGARNVSMGPVEEVKRRPETPKRRTTRVDTSRSKIPSVKPPHFSMVP
jgi:hypothetical protein